MYENLADGMCGRVAKGQYLTVKVLTIVSHVFGVTDIIPYINCQGFGL